MTDSDNDLMHAQLSFGFFYLFLGISVGLLCCLVKRYDLDDREHNNNDDLVSSTITVCVGVQPFVLRSIPTIDFNSKDFKDMVECAICLAELVDGDKARALPSCDHLFHVECIDSWLKSHSTCPICRKSVCFKQRGTRQELGGGGDEGLSQNHDPITSEHHELPTNPPPMSTDTTVIEDGGCGGEDEGLPDGPDLTEVVIDVPAKEMESGPC
ncbi:PREDICTED: putative RING-H2 finger protein ATL61 [Camelina sativa]|uniref:RING-type E3 ubiquitin transferase n=1 Tax=Camelina sativa TaxID=90675 RepID=A0ABM0WAN2_CAMSA|nr:PREDICTED: putative RING-H2 finger protein ATL61 [Camelina sativa]